MTNQNLTNKRLSVQGTSLQDVFDKALFGIRGQGYKKSSTLGGGCKYHIPHNDLRCAVGHCIPDAVAERWDAYNGDTDIASIRKASPEDYEQFFSQDDLPLLQSLQVIHDTMPDENKAEVAWVAKLFEAQMQQLAQNYGLVYTPVAPQVGSLNLQDLFNRFATAPDEVDICGKLPQTNTEGS